MWTTEQIQALGAATDLPTAASVLGIGRSHAYHLAAVDAFPTPVIRAGTRLIVPVAALLRLLQLDHPPEADRGRLDRHPDRSVDAVSVPPADSPHRRHRIHDHQGVHR